MASNWSELPEELVDMVVELLVCVDEVIRFGAVCKSWRFISILQNQNKKKVYTPMMMLSYTENDNGHDEDVRWFVIPYKGPEKIKCFDLMLPKAQGTTLWGSPYGWVVTVDLDKNIGLLNPLTGAQLLLPPLNQASCIIKLVLIWHQSSQSWLVMAIFGERSEVAFAFTGIGNKPYSFSSSWTLLESTIETQDVILFQDRIYLVGYKGNLSVCDINEGTPTPKAIHIAPQPEGWFDIPLYLVEIGGDLHLVVRYAAHIGDEDDIAFHEFTSHFVVWRFNFTDTKWYKLDDLGEYALFLGNNASFAISTNTYPDFERNHIYFTQEFDYILNSPFQLFWDAGVYNYGERIVELFDNANMGASSSFGYPIFFMPTL